MTRTPTRLAAWTLVGLLASVAVASPALAQSQLNVRSVGELFVDAQGRVSGQNVVALVSESDGRVSKFTSLALGAEVFSSVSVDGFSQAEKIKGVGSSALVLKGSHAVVSLHDDASTALKVGLAQAGTIRYKLASDVSAKADAGRQGVVDLYGRGGTLLGSLVALGKQGATRTETMVVSGSEVRVEGQAGTQVVFLGRPLHVGGAELLRAVVSAAASGSLASTYVTEFEGSAVRFSDVAHVADYSARTAASAKGGVQTDVKSRQQHAAVLAYDLAYETLPARSAGDVAVYVDGVLAERAATAAQVATYAAAGVATYFAQSHGGRSQVLVATPDFSHAAEHRVSVVANAQASTESQASAENGADERSRVYGGFEYHDNGKLTGDFLTSILVDGKLQLWSYTSLASQTEIFKGVVVDGGAQGSFRALDGHRFRVDGPKADLTLVDDVYTTMLVEAKARSDVTYELGEGVKAVAVSPELLRLEGPHGHAGVLLLVEGDTAGSRLVSTSDGQAKAQLQQGAQVVFRSSADQHASEDAVARAIAQGRIGAQLLAGVQDSGLATASTTYGAGVSALLEARERGSLAIDYTSRLETAKSFVLDARGASLAAKSAADVRVLVDGRPAVPAPDASAALATSGYAKYYAETGAEGGLRVIVNTAAAAGDTAHVLVESKVASAARAAANADAFGTFKLFYDGTAVGSFVTLRADQQAGAVTDFTMISTGRAVFGSIASGASPFVSAGADGASTLVLENRESRMEFSDTTSGFMRVVAKADAEAAFRLAAGLHVEEKSATVLEVVSDQADHVGTLIITNADGGAASASRFRATAEGQVQAQLQQGAQVLFRTHVGIEAELSGAQRAMMNSAIAAGHVAGQVVVQTQASLSAEAHAAAAEAARRAAGASFAAQEAVAVSAAEASGKVTAAVTASYFSDVQMLTAATRERVDVTVSSTAKVGKTVIVSLDPATVPGMMTGDAMILFDGEVAAQASSYADILDPNDDAGAAEYFVLAGEAGTQVLVSIPHFSVHTVTLQQRPVVEANSLYMYATIFLAVVLVVETTVLVRRRKA